MQNFGSDDDSVIADINVTPFVDILLVLLVVFMVTAPIMTRSVGVNLPQEQLKSKRKAQPLSPAVTLVLGINLEQEVIYKKKSYKMTVFFKNFNDLVQVTNIKRVFIQADRKTAYESVLSLMVFLKNQGFENVGLVFNQK
jgi:biopolymer transport protein TolR